MTVEQTPMRNIVLHSISLVVGDRWNDGHGRYQTFPFVTNRTITELWNYYTAAARDLDVDVHAIVNTDGRRRRFTPPEVTLLATIGWEWDARDTLDRESYVDLFILMCEYGAKLVDETLMITRIHYQEMELGGYSFFQ